MTGEDRDYNGIPSRRREQLTASIQTLLEEHGQAAPVVGLAINAGFIAIGAAVYLYLSGWPAYGGALVAILGAEAIIKWVVQA